MSRHGLPGRLVAVVGLLCALMVPSGCSSSGEGDQVVERIRGTNRFETAVEVSAIVTPVAADAVVVIPARHPAEALPGAALAASLGASALITESTSLNDTIVGEVARIAPSELILIGDEVSDEVEGALGDIASTRRLSGNTPATVAAATARRSPAFEDADTIYLAPLPEGGDMWQPAMVAAAAVAAEPDRRILLLSAPGHLSAPARAVLDEVRPDEVVAVGFPFGDDDAVEDVRTAGHDLLDVRAEDPGVLADLVSQQAGTGDARTVVVAAVSDYADAVVLPPLLAELDAALLLASPFDDRADGPVARALAERQPDEVHIAGGTSAISTRVARRLADAIGASVPETRGSGGDVVLVGGLVVVGLVRAMRSRRVAQA